MLSVNHVTKYYDEFLAVDNISFDVKEGEIFGLLGVNGAGKTTTFRMILGLLDKSSGDITLDGKKIDYSMTDKIGFLAEERSLLLRLTVFEQAMFYGKLKGMNSKQIEEKLDYYLKRLDIVDYKNKKIKELSKGNQQKVQFITALLNDPKLLILDEPFSGLDPVNIELFKSVILELKKKGTMIIFSTHRMDHAEYFCEKLVILVKGKTVLSGSLKDIKKEYKKKNIHVKASINEKNIMNIDGVESIDKVGEEYIIKVKDETVTNKVFKVVSKAGDCVKFLEEEATLDEIFISKVGEYYE